MFDTPDQLGVYFYTEQYTDHYVEESGDHFLCRPKMGLLQCLDKV